MKKQKKTRTISLATRIKQVRADCEAEVDRLAEELRPKGEGKAVPAVSMRRQWLAMANDRIEDAYLIATGQL